MAAAGTLLADLDSQGGGNDGDLVHKILADMNIPTGGSNRTLPPPMPAQTPMTQHMEGPPSMSMDSRIPTAHMIGNEHPSSADFAAAMQGMGTQQMPRMQQMHEVQMPGVPASGTYSPPSKNMYSYVISELKVPLVVALLFFIFSLPPIRVLIAHYVPTLIKSTGEFHTSGLLAVSAMVGLSFWVLNRIIVPLLSF